MMYVDDPANLRVDALVSQPRPPLEAVVETREDLADPRKRWAAVEAGPGLISSRAAGVDQSWGGLDIRTFLRGEQSAGRFSVHNLLLAPGAGLAPHYHQDAHVVLI